MHDDIKGEVLYNDNRIRDVAIYAATAGNTRNYLSKPVIKFFKEFKMQLKIGEFKDIDELEEDVYKRFGVINSNNKIEITSEDMQHLKDMHEEFKRRDEEKKKRCQDMHDQLPK